MFSYLLARPPPGGKFGMFSAERLRMIQARSGTPSSPAFSMISESKTGNRNVTQTGTACDPY